MGPNHEEHWIEKPVLVMLCHLHPATNCAKQQQVPREPGLSHHLEVNLSSTHSRVQLSSHEEVIHTEALLWLCIIQVQDCAIKVCNDATSCEQSWILMVQSREIKNASL